MQAVEQAVSDRIKVQLCFEFCRKSERVSLTYFVLVGLLLLFPTVVDGSMLALQRYVGLPFLAFVLFRRLHARWIVQEGLINPAKFWSAYRWHFVIVTISNLMLSVFVWSPFLDSHANAVTDVIGIILIAGLNASSSTTAALHPPLSWLMLTILGVMPALVLAQSSRYSTVDRWGLFGLVVVFLVFIWQSSREFYQLMRQRVESEDLAQVEKLELAKLLTQLQQTQKELFESRARAEHASKLAALGEMAGGVAHEVNNPLAIIRAYAQRLEEYKVDLVADRSQSFAERVRKIVFAVDRVVRIVQGLRSFSRQDNDDPMGQVDLKLVVLETLDLCAERLKSEAILVKVDWVGSGFRVAGRPAQLSQVLMNLLGNARDAMSASDSRVIVIRSTRAGAAIEIRVIDTGSGIHPEDRERVFDPFYTTKEVGKGTGLGLSISKGIVESHGGSLEIERSDASGTTFLIVLPALGVEADEVVPAVAVTRDRAMGVVQTSAQSQPVY